MENSELENGSNTDHFKDASYMEDKFYQKFASFKNLNLCSKNGLLTKIMFCYVPSGTKIRHYQIGAGSFTVGFEFSSYFRVF